MELTNGYVSDRSIMDTYGKGWQLFRDNVGLFLGIIIVTMLISIPASLGNGEDAPIVLATLASAYSFFIATPISMSTAWTQLRAARGEDAKVGDIFAIFQRNYVNALIASILMGIAIFIGFLLLVIPGIIIAIRLGFVPYLIVDERLSAVDAIKKSWDMTRGYGLTIFGMGLLSIPIFLLGLIALVVGVFVSIAVVSASFAVFYHSVAIAYNQKQKPKNDEYAFE